MAGPSQSFSPVDFFGLNAPQNVSEYFIKFILIQTYAPSNVASRGSSFASQSSFTSSFKASAEKPKAAADDDGFGAFQSSSHDAWAMGQGIGNYFTNFNHDLVNLGNLKKKDDQKSSTKNMNVYDKQKET